MSQTAGESLEIAVERHFSYPKPFRLECGGQLDGLTLAYETWGELGPDGDNAVFVCHALTGSAHAASHSSRDESGWWEGLIGPRKALDPSRHFIVCANVLGSCYGSSGPASLNGAKGPHRGMRFPPVTTLDMVRAFKLLLDSLGVKRLALVIGGSLGAMLVWQWLTEYPDFVQSGIPIAGTAQASPWAIALNAVARQAIRNDPAWKDGNYEGFGPRTGFALARMIAMITYRSELQFAQRFGRDRVDPAPESLLAFDNDFQVESYLRHQGEKVVRRFDPRSYVYLTKAMDLHDVALGYSSLEEALGRIKARVLAVGIDSDVLFAPQDIQATAETLRRLGADAAYAEIYSPCGHDAFLVEHAQVNTIVSSFLEGKPLCEF
jgi:homoserine O-acetyltransferase